MEYTTNLNDAHEKAIKCYIDNIYMETDIMNVVVVNDTVETINGIEMYRYEGYAEWIYVKFLDTFFGKMCLILY